MSGTGVGAAVVTHPAALLAIRPGPGTPAGETVPPPVTIFTTQTTRSRLLTTYTAHALLTLTSLLYDNLAARGLHSHAARKRLLAGQRNVGKQPSRHTRHAYQLPSTCPSPT